MGAHNFITLRFENDAAYVTVRGKIIGVLRIQSSTVPLISLSFSFCFFLSILPGLC